MADATDPLFLRLAQALEDAIIEYSLSEEARVPSTKELAASYRVNGATASRGVNALVDRGVIYKRRGVGMFVAPGARDRLLTQRRSAFAGRFVEPMLREARRLSIDSEELAAHLQDALRLSGPRIEGTKPVPGVSSSDPTAGA